MTTEQAEAVKALVEAESSFLAAFGWKIGDMWESPKWYKKRKSISCGWDDELKDWVPLANQDLYKRDHAINSLKAHIKGIP